MLKTEKKSSRDKLRRKTKRNNGRRRNQRSLFYSRDLTNLWIFAKRFNMSASNIIN